MNTDRMASFVLGGMTFEYDEEKNQKNIRKHGISFKSAARVFFDYDRIEYYDEEHSEQEDRYNTIGDTSAGNLKSFNPSAAKTGTTIIGNVESFIGNVGDILYVVYTERGYSSAKGRTVTESAHLKSPAARGRFPLG